GCSWASGRSSCWSVFPYPSVMECRVKGKPAPRLAEGRLRFRPRMAQRQEERSNRELNRDISRSLAALFKDATGRGPTHARTYVQENFVITVFQDMMTKPERSLKEEHQEDTLRDLRRLFQETLRRARDESIGAAGGPAASIDRRGSARGAPGR